MGRIPYPIYGEDLGSAIEDAEKVIAKIKTNKYNEKELFTLVEINNTILKYILENKK